MEKTIEINRIPSITWNWMKMNKDNVTIDFALKSLNPKISVPFENKNSDVITEKNCFKVFSPDSSITSEVGKLLEERRKTFADKISTAAGEEISNLIEETSKPVIITANGIINEPLYLNFTQEKDSHCTSYQIIHAFPNTECTVIFLYESRDEEESFAALHTKIFLEEGAKVHVVKVQLLGNDANQIDDTSFLCGERSQAKFTQIELGGKHIDSGLYTTLSGYKSDFKSNVAYLSINDQYLDMNHVVLHKGQKTECNMDVYGTIGGSALKSYRGTIDFKKGCSGAKGNEMEETLLLSPTVINKSLPVILCDEEDVEGEHGATLGRLSSDILFYMQTRGIDQKAAEKLMAKAKVKRAAANIPDEEICKKISSFIDNRI